MLTPEHLFALAESRNILTLGQMPDVALKGVEGNVDMPVRILLEAGVPFSINTDDHAYQGS